MGLGIERRIVRMGLIRGGMDEKTPDSGGYRESGMWVGIRLFLDFFGYALELVERYVVSVDCGE